MKCYLILCLLILLMIGCKKHSSELSELIRAENLINIGQYNEALDIIDSLKNQTTKSKKDEALTNLLWIQAKDKIGDTPDNDSLINKVIEYYIVGKHAPERHAMVYYYAGRINAELQNRIVALQYFQKALDAQKKYNNTPLQSYIHSQIGHILILSGLYKSALRHYKKEYECEIKTGNIEEAADTKLRIAYAFRCIGENDSARNIYLEYENLLPSIFSPQRQKEFSTQLLSFFTWDGKYEKADSIIKVMALDQDSSVSSTLQTILNRINLYKGLNSTVKETSIKLLSEHNVYIQRKAAENLSQIYLEEGNPNKSLHYTKIFKDLSSEINEIEAAEALAEMEAIYDYSESERENNLLKEENQKKRNLIIWLSLSIGLLVLIIASSVLAFKLWKTKNDLRQEEALREADRIIQEKSAESEKLQGELDDLKASVAKMVDCTPDTIPEDNAELAKIYDTKRREQELNLSKTITEIVSKATAMNGKLTDEDFIKLEEAIAELYPKLISTLRKMNLSQRNFRDSLLIIAKIPVKICAFMFSVTPQAISTSRSRLFKKYAPDSDKKDWAAYLQSFCEREKE